MILFQRLLLLSKESEQCKLKLVECLEDFQLDSLLDDSEIDLVADWAGGHFFNRRNL